MVYPILDLDSCREKGREPGDLVRSWMDLGLEWYQVRVKSGTIEDAKRLSERLGQIAPRGKILINDYWKLALELSEPVYGFHVGQKDLDQILEDETDRETFLEALHRDHWIAGVSTHNPDELFRILPEAYHWDYIAMGPFFPTKSKKEDLSPSLDQARRDDLYQAICGLKQEASHEGEKKTDGSLLVSKDGKPTHLVLIGGIGSQNIDSLMAEVMERTGGVRPLVSVIGGAMDLPELRRIIELMSPYYA